MRTALVLLLVVLGSTLLVRFAPGYLSDAREMDGRFAGSARAELAKEASRSSLAEMLHEEAHGLRDGSLGLSREYGIPVSELMAPRLAVTGRLLLDALALAWCAAGSVALLSSLAHRPSLLVRLPSTLLLALPAAALATACLISGQGGPVLVLGVLLAARDFKFLDRILWSAWRSPHLQHARALGVRLPRLIVAHLLPDMAPQLLAVVTLSLFTALSAIVPVEVIFGVPGVGQLAWHAAINRDLPVLLAVTVVMALAVTVAGTPTSRDRLARQVSA